MRTMILVMLSLIFMLGCGGTKIDVRQTASSSLVTHDLAQSLFLFVDEIPKP